MFKRQLLLQLAVTGGIHTRRLAGRVLVLESEVSKLQEEVLELRKNQKSPHEVLTGTLTREYFEKAAEQLLVIRHRRSAEAVVDHLALVMIDLDYFKLVNDTYGHAAGDEVLRVFGHIAQNHLREHDMVARWGGDEFMIILQGVDSTTVPKVIEKLRKEFEAATFSFHLPDDAEVARVRPSFSFGYALHRAGETLPEMILRADGHMYVRKKERKAART
jgi:diguanylate cyclase (GGDEF)-like protein